MRLRKLLLGSAAVVLAAGTANAADPIAVPAGIVTMGTMNYALYCSDDADGIMLEEWCVALDWSNFSWEMGFGTEIEFEDTADGPTGNTFQPVGPGPLWPWWAGPDGSGAAITMLLTRETPMGWEIEVRVSDFDDVRMRLTTPGGTRFEFGDDYLEVRFPTGLGNFTTRLSQSDDGVAAGRPNLGFQFDPSFGNVDLRMALLLDSVEIGGAPVYTIGGGADATFDVGPAEVKIGAWTNVTEFGGAPGTRAYGVGAQAAIEVGANTELTFGGNWSLNGPTGSSSGMAGVGHVPAFARYHYEWSDMPPLGSYWGAFAQAEVESGMGTTRLRFSLNDGPLPAGAGDDRTMDVALRHTLDLGDTPVDLFGEVVMQRAWNPAAAAMGNAFAFTLGVTGNLP
jgi:hypothetical protein